MNKRGLKSGYTTGTCAALASKAAAELLLSGNAPESVSVITPKGGRIDVRVEKSGISGNAAFCSVVKDSGDDPDITNGIEVFSSVCLSDNAGIEIDGGEGVGRVTKPGLEQKPGEAAINRVPRKMIEAAVSEILEKYGCKRGARVVISIPEGVRIAEKTFNPRLGIVGGISVLGTSGIVEPMSEKALIDTIEVELKYRRANGDKCAVIVPGNYGMDFLSEEIGLDSERAVKCSNFVGEAVDFCRELGFSRALFVGHMGKFVKLAAGIMNTHSKNADARMEIITAHAALCGASSEVCKRLMECVSTDDAVGVLKDTGIKEPVMSGIMDKIDYHITRRADTMKVGVVVFSKVHGILGKTQAAEEIINEENISCGNRPREPEDSHASGGGRGK